MIPAAVEAFTWLLAHASNAPVHEDVPLHQCNDCGILIPDHLELCGACERWYEGE